MTAFSAELKRAMTIRGVTRADIYRPLGACSSLAKRWTTGEAFPDHGTVLAIADLLDWPHLVTLSLAARSGTCEACGAPTLATRGPRPPRFCGARCIRRTRDRQLNARKRLQAVGVVKRERDLLREAVAAMCRGCEPEGLCRDAECALRPVSPLPLASARLRVA